ncbi:MAG: hypothetical protein WBE44_04715 [Terriglobales bacterium]
MNKSSANAAEGSSDPKSDLLSCDDIYHASGILGARSRYGINKIIEMLASKHIRDLSKDVKRASVLMALDAADSTVDEVLQDAARRQHALGAYEAGQQKQFANSKRAMFGKTPRFRSKWSASHRTTPTASSTTWI